MGIIQIKFDGACRNVPNQSSVMGIGVAVFFDNEYVEEESVAIQIVPESVRGTSNIAEWEGCIEAWKIAMTLYSKYPGNTIKIYSDSQLITNQFNGLFAINNLSFSTYYKMGKEIQDKILPSIAMIEWIPREENKEADKLSKIGLKVGLISRGELSVVS